MKSLTQRQKYRHLQFPVRVWSCALARAPVLGLSFFVSVLFVHKQSVKSLRSGEGGDSHYSIAQRYQRPQAAAAPVDLSQHMKSLTQRQKYRHLQFPVRVWSCALARAPVLGLAFFVSVLFAYKPSVKSLMSGEGGDSHDSIVQQYQRPQAAVAPVDLSQDMKSLRRGEADSSDDVTQ